MVVSLIRNIVFTALLFTELSSSVHEVFGKADVRVPEMNSSEVQLEALVKQRFLNEAMGFTGWGCAAGSCGAPCEEKVLGGSCETCLGQIQISPSSLSSPGSSACRCLL